MLPAVARCLFARDGENADWPLGHGCTIGSGWARFPYGEGVAVPHAVTNVLTDQLATLFGSGTCAGMTDGDLLERFRTGRDAAGERAWK
jgi:hypothetical protein